MKATRDQFDLFQGSLSFDAAPPIPVTHDIPADPIAFFRQILQDHHAAMMRADTKECERLRDKAHGLAEDMNGGTRCGITGPGGPGLMLEDATKAEPGTVPLWGQIGDFEITVDGIRTRIHQDGIFGICGTWDFWFGFDARVIEKGKPFPISQTGYRSFICDVHQFEPEPNLTPDAFAAQVIRAYLASLPKPKARRKKKA